LSESRIREGASVQVCLNPEVTSRNRNYLSGKVIAIVSDDYGNLYRVKHKAKWGDTSSWFREEQIVSFTNP